MRATPRFHLTAAALLVLPVLTTIATTANDAGAARSSAAVLEPCHLDGLREEVRCGRLTVPRDPATPDAGTIEVTFAVVPALASRRSPDPLFVFPGGPGQAGTGYGPLVVTSFAEVRETRDLVLLDPRGTSGAAALRCEVEGMLWRPTSEGTRALRDCARGLGIAPRWYSSRLVAADAEAVRTALGHGHVNLWGGSYGTRFALEYATLYPEHTRAVVLDGAIGPRASILVDAARHAETAFERLVGECQDDAECSRAFPDLRADRDAFVGANETTLHRERDPITGDELRVELDRDARIGLVRGALYSPRHAALLPLALHRGRDGDLGPILALGAATASWSVDTMATGATLAVLCADETPRITREQAATLTAGTFVGDSYARYWLESCEALSSNDHEPGLASDVAAERPLEAPALVLSGDRDPVTPPASGAIAAAVFARAAHVVVPGAGHNVSHLGCVPELMRTFLDHADPEAIDPSCIEAEPAPPFATGPAGFSP